MIYQVTKYTRYDTKPRRIRWKLHQLHKQIPKEYHPIANPNERLRRALKRKPVDYSVLTDPLVLRKCRQYKKYKEMLNKSKLSRITEPMIDSHFNDINNALEYVKKFDDERCYYTWLKISEIYPLDEYYPKTYDDDFEFIANCLVPKSDRWFKLEITEVGEKVVGWGRTYDHTYTEQDPPIYLKGYFL